LDQRRLLHGQTTPFRRTAWFTTRAVKSPDTHDRRTTANPIQRVADATAGQAQRAESSGCDSPRLEDISRLFFYGTEQRQGRQREEQHREEPCCDKRRVDGGTEKI
jgi:hypothetical protein